ncbi:MAG: DNA-formamidopyrimidine glycosylase family protein [Fimbriimonadaceae bacterium]
MPELPEVESVCRVMRRVLEGKRIAAVEVVPDDIVCRGIGADLFAGKLVKNIGRKGKYFWFEFDSPPVVYGHLGMAGWIREVRDDIKETRIREHGNAPLYDEDGRPRFLKLMLTAPDGRKVAMTDGRRLARLWVGDDPATDKKLKQLGPDVFNEPYSAERLQAVLKGRTAPIKASLLDQKLFCGVGNWIADEVLYQARISPKRTGDSLKKADIERLLDSLKEILTITVDCEADKDQLPKSWMFHHRWGGDKGEDEIEGKPIRREQVGGRTTAWVPGLQK